MKVKRNKKKFEKNANTGGKNHDARNAADLEFAIMVVKSTDVKNVVVLKFANTGG